MLAKAAGGWKSAHNFSGRLILPLIFTHQNQINGKTERNPKVELGRRCYDEARADGFWVVDASLGDESGSRTLRNTRLPALVALHQELNDKISSKIRIAGPYWGMNLVLWARGLVEHPAIGVGGGFQYFSPGGHAKRARVRLAIGSLRRRVNTSGLGAWLDDASKTLGTDHPVYAQLQEVRKRLHLLVGEDPARQQVASVYKKWFDSLAAVPATGRSLALFQDLSAAYALGKSLPNLGQNEGTARRPESVAEPLMLNCL